MEQGRGCKTQFLRGRGEGNSLMLLWCVYDLGVLFLRPSRCRVIVPSFDPATICWPWAAMAAEPRCGTCAASADTPLTA